MMQFAAVIPGRPLEVHYKDFSRILRALAIKRIVLTADRQSSTNQIQSPIGSSFC
jgi:hypothetical protein